MYQCGTVGMLVNDSLQSQGKGSVYIKGKAGIA